MERTEDSVWELAPLIGASFIPVESVSFSSSIAAEAQLSLLRPQFEIQHYGEVFRVPLWAGSIIARAGFIW